MWIDQNEGLESLLLEANSAEKTSFTLQPGAADSELEANPTAGEASMHLEGYHFRHLYFYLSDYTFRQQNQRKETPTQAGRGFPIWQIFGATKFNTNT